MGADGALDHQALSRQLASCANGLSYVGGAKPESVMPGGSDGSSAAFAAATASRRAFVSSCTKICTVAASGTAVSAPSTPRSAPNNVTETMMKKPERLTALPWIFGREDVVLDLLVDEHDDEHDERGHQPFLGPERGHEDEARDRGADVGDHVEQPRDHGDARARSSSRGATR